MTAAQSCDLCDLLDKIGKRIGQDGAAFGRPRLKFLAAEPLQFDVALPAIVAALASIPLSLALLAPSVLGATIILIGVGVTARDGLLLGTALAITYAGGGYWLATRWP